MPLRPALLLPFSIVDTEKLQFAVQSRPFHPDKARCTRDIAGKTTYLNLQIFAFEALPRFTQGSAHDCLVAHHIARSPTRNLGREPIHVDTAASSSPSQNNYAFNTIENVPPINRKFT